MAANTRIVIGPNASLDVRGAVWFLVTVSVPAVVVAGICTAYGFWPVLPFAGLELTAVGAAVWVSLRRNGYREVVTVDERQVVIEFGLLGRGAFGRVELPRGWTRVTYQAGRYANEPSRLWLGASGQRVEVGRCLTDAERIQLAARFKELLLMPDASRSIATGRNVEAAGKPFGD